MRLQQELRLRGRLTKQFVLRSLLYLPKGYRTPPHRCWPLLLFVHGAGERGNLLLRVAKHGPRKLVARNRDFPFVIVAPQCLAGRSSMNGF